MDDARSGPDRTLLAILVALVVLVIAALLIVFTRGAPELLDPETPEGVVQRYAEAVLEGDEAAATALLTDEVADDCVRMPRTGDDGVRVTLVGTTDRGETADVEVRIVTTYADGPFGASEYEERGTFDLVRVDGDWRIETAPWPLAVCDPSTVGR
ncbi:hypothetical protein [Agromyces sp. SYSU T0242]|uniref:hypothetical protein n=1 Tax=Agromyces litoreus TaxID=3158561 RepID=UPI00339100D2